MKYIPPFERLKALMHENLMRDTGVTAPAGGAAMEKRLMELTRPLLYAVEFDERWYLQRYPDIAEAIRAGHVKSARRHFIDNGYFEGRQPFPIRVDEQWYLDHNPGVAAFVAQGQLESAQQHFDENGYEEGRLPFALE